VTEIQILRKIRSLLLKTFSKVGIEFLPQTWYGLQRTLHNAAPACDAYCCHQRVGQETATAPYHNQNQCINLCTSSQNAHIPYR